MDRVEDNTTMELELENDSSKGITRRESLKKLTIGAYAVPATALLLTAERAVAQSVPGIARVFTIHNNSAVAIPIVYTNGQGVVVNTNLAAGNSVPLTCSVFTNITLAAGAVVLVVQDIPNHVYHYN